jgi:4-amino-4-deoxy-L-arabinose transferase-like glycosyltransferase
MKVVLVLKKSWVLLLVLGFALFLRLVNLEVIPVFADEAIYIHWAQKAWHDHTQRFISLTDGKPPLHTWLLIPFLKFFTDPLIAGRLLSVVSGFFTLLGLFLIVRRVFSFKQARIALIFGAVSPFLLFYDRLAVADSLLTALGVWSFYLSLKLFEKPDLGKAFLLGFCWGGGLLTKQPASFFIILSPLVFLLVYKLSLKDILSFKTNKLFRKKYLKHFLFVFFALLIAFLSYNLVKLSPYSHLLSVRSYDYILGKKEFLKDPFKLFWGNLKAILYWVYSYQTLFGALLFGLGFLFMLKDKLRQALVFSAFLFLPLLSSAAIGRIIFPRYFVFIQPWIIIFISFAVLRLFNLLKNRNRLLSLLAVFLSLLPWLVFSILLVFRPTKAPLEKREQDQYLTSWSSGYGLKQIALYLKTNYPEQKVYVATEGFFGTLPDGLQIYLDKYSNIEVYGIGQPISQPSEEVFKRAAEAPTFIVVNDTRYLGNQENLELVNSYPKPEFPFLKEKLLFFKVLSK